MPGGLPMTAKPPEPELVIEWREPPPKMGRRRALRPEEIRAGQRIRDQIRQSRLARGIPWEGTVFPGETPDCVKPHERRKDEG